MTSAGRFMVLASNLSAMKVALTGASGFIGSWTARTLHGEGHLVRALVRSSSRRDHIDPYLDGCVIGSVEERDAHLPLLQDCEALIHNAIDWRLIREGAWERHLDANLAASIELMHLAAQQGMHIIFVSSVAVHHEILPEWNGRIDGTHPMRPGGMYGACKAALEAHVWMLRSMHDIPCTIIRPAAVYGIDPALDRSIGVPILQRVRKGETLRRKGGGKFVHVDDVAQSMVRSLNCQSADGSIYHLADCYARWSDWGEMACEILGQQVEIDDSSPEQPKNMFTTDELAQDLNLPLDRGHTGIKDHLKELAALI